MHVLRKLEDKVQYTYVQQSDPKIHLPDFMLKGPQVKVLFGEIEGLRTAVKKK